MRRTGRPVLGPLFAALLAASVGVVLLMAPTAALAASTPDMAILAAEQTEPVGPDPLPREAENNPARELAGYENQETPFTWGAAWLLAAAGIFGLVVMLGLYRLLVQRPRKEHVRSR